MGWGREENEGCHRMWVIGLGSDGDPEKGDGNKRQERASREGNEKRITQEIL